MENEPSLDRLDSQLRQAAKLLNDCAKLIRDIQLDSKSNIRRIGEALVNVFEIQNQIYERRPDLTPDHLKDSKGS